MAQAPLLFLHPYMWHVDDIVAVPDLGHRQVLDHQSSLQDGWAWSLEREIAVKTSLRDHDSIATQSVLMVNRWSSLCLLSRSAFSISVARMSSQRSFSDNIP